MALDLSSLEKALTSLEKTLNLAEQEIKGKVNTIHEQALRSAVIQNFDFTFELSWKFIKRWLEENDPDPVDGITRKELFRMAAENRLIEQVKSWFAYYKSRNMTSHTYDSEKADQVYATAQEFVADAKKLLAALKSKND